LSKVLNRPLFGCGSAFGFAAKGFEPDDLGFDVEQLPFETGDLALDGAAVVWKFGVAARDRPKVRCRTLRAF
jgi:hypothetical protein